MKLYHLSLIYARYILFFHLLLIPAIFPMPTAIFILFYNFHDIFPNLIYNSLKYFTTKESEYFYGPDQKTKDSQCP